MDDLLKIEDLKISYYTYAGEVQSVRGVSFSVRKGETLAIVGESGCGKSVTAKSIMGLIQVPPGEIKEGSKILLKGKNLLEQSEKEWESYRGAKMCHGISGCAYGAESYDADWKADCREHHKSSESWKG